MQKEFKVHKGGKGSFELLSSKDISGRHRLLRFKHNEENFQKEDALWAIEDKERNQVSTMVIVEEARHYVADEGIVSLLVRNVDSGFIGDMRKFEDGELFTLVATFREESFGPEG